MLALLGYLRDPSRGPDEVRRQCSTFSEWKKTSDANPITYPSLTPELLRSLRGTGALFARKFHAGAVSAEKWDVHVRAAAAEAEDVDRDVSLKKGALSATTTSAQGDSSQDMGADRNSPFSEISPPLATVVGDAPALKKMKAM